MMIISIQRRTRMYGMMLGGLCVLLCVSHGIFSYDGEPCVDNVHEPLDNPHHNEANIAKYKDLARQMSGFPLTTSRDRVFYKEEHDLGQACDAWRVQRPVMFAIDIKQVSHIMNDEHKTAEFNFLDRCAHMLLDYAKALSDYRALEISKAMVGGHRDLGNFLGRGAYQLHEVVKRANNFIFLLNDPIFCTRRSGVFGGYKVKGNTTINELFFNCCIRCIDEAKLIIKDVTAQVSYLYEVASGEGKYTVKFEELDRAQEVIACWTNLLNRAEDQARLISESGDLAYERSRLAPLPYWISQ